jgi:hypothetical protein
LNGISYFLDKEIETSEAPNHASAYMLVYIRKDMIQEILNPMSDSNISNELIKVIEERRKFETENV